MPGREVGSQFDELDIHGRRRWRLCLLTSARRGARRSPSWSLKPGMMVGVAVGQEPREGSPWGPIRGSLIIVGLLLWPLGADICVAGFVSSDRVFFLGWLLSVLGLLLAGGTALTALFRNDAPGWSFPSGLRGVFRRLRLPLPLFLGVWLVLFLALPLLMAIVILSPVIVPG